MQFCVCALYLLQPLALLQLCSLVLLRTSLSDTLLQVPHYMATANSSFLQSCFSLAFVMACGP